MSFFLQAGTDYDLLDRHHLSNHWCRSPSPTFLAGVWSGNHKDDCSSKRMCFSTKAGDGQTTTAVPKSRDATAVVPRSREVSGTVLQLCDGATAVLRPHKDACAIPLPCWDATIAPRPRQDAHAVP